MAREFQFYIIPTPIGNISDITLRAIEVMKSVDLICCEDSRVTQKLLNHYDIKTKTVSYHKYNEKERVDFLMNFLKEGKTLALVSDAGTPMICDPGSVLLTELKANNITVTALSGSCAVTTFLSQVPRDSEQFKFIGFLPRTQEKVQNLLQENSKEHLVFYESPNRILKTLNFIKEYNANSKVAVGRELTKLFEEILIDNVENLISHFEQNEPKGEFVVMVYPTSNVEGINIEEKIAKLKAKGFKSKEIATILSALYDLNKNDIYKLSI